MREKSEMTLREAAQQALKALELGCTDHDGNPVDLVGPAITALRASLAETTINKMETVEPVAWLIEAYDIYEKCTLQRLVFDKPKNMQGVKITAYYIAPPKREPLTEEKISAIDWKSGETLHDFARAIERAHGIGGDE